MGSRLDLLRDHLEKKHGDAPFPEEQSIIYHAKRLSRRILNSEVRVASRIRGMPVTSEQGNATGRAGLAVSMMVVICGSYITGVQLSLLSTHRFAWLLSWFHNTFLGGPYSIGLRKQNAPTMQFSL